MADLRDFTGKNRKFTGTIGERISVGTTAERDTATFGGGTIRFNTTTNLMEYYTGTEWKSIDAPPTITNFNVDGAGTTTSTFIDRTQSGNTSIVITGSLYSSGAVVSFRGNNGANFDATTTTFNNASQVTAVVPYSSFLAAQEPYSIRVTNLSGLFAQLDDCLVVDATPVFTTAAGSLGTIFDTTRSTYSLLTAAATDVDGDTITYSISAGSLPAGLSISSSTGAITGTASAVATDTTSTFTVSAATSAQTATRQFSITVKAPLITSYTSTGAFTYSVPSGASTANVLVVAGGAYGGGGTGGGGGAGGMIEVTGFNLAPYVPTGVPGSVGAGSPGGIEVSPGAGTNSVFGSLTAIGGGSAGWDNSPSGRAPQPGGSGGGGNGYNPRARGSGTGTQPSQPGASGSSGFGNPGSDAAYNGGGGGGGAGGAAMTGDGGAGRSSSVSGSSVTYAGGGAGGGPSGGHTGGPGGGGPGSPGPGDVAGRPGSANRGGGGGGAWDHAQPGGAGGSGIVVVAI